MIMVTHRSKGVSMFVTLIIVITFSLNNFMYFAHGISVDDTGGYRIVLSIDNAIVEPQNARQYIQKVQQSLQIFSTELSRATKGRFYIRSAELLLPSEWIQTTTLPATIQSFSSSDIRLLGEDVFPYTENPNACGLPGKFIQLPYTFFNSLNFGTYGKNWKALLTQWARFRWGVWEEHGYPGHTKFRYFHLETEDDHWKETSCSNVPLVGTYMNGDNTVCSVEQFEPPGESCRFIPNPVNVASTSIMSFHWLESNVHFCDVDTHNKESPNRQNSFCNYRSIWEVIRETPDFKIATSEPIWAVPVINFKTFQQLSESRPLYVLLDRGELDMHAQQILLRIIPELGTLISTNLEDSVLISIAEYPGTEKNQVKELRSWTHLGSQSDRVELLDIIGELPSEGEPLRDFSAAIGKAIQKIEMLNSANGGAILLVIKTGAYNSIDIAFEESVFTALSKNKIKLFAAEVTNPNEDSFLPASLESLARRTGGGHASLANFQTVAEQTRILLDEVAGDISIPADPNLPVEILSQKFYLNANTPVTVDLRKMSTVSIRLTLPKDIEPIMMITGPQNPMLELADEWGMTVRQSQIYAHTFNEDDVELTMSFRCETPSNCVGQTGHVLITEKFNDFQEQSSRIKVSVNSSASAFGYAINFETTPIGFSIYAKVELDSMPVVNARVMATVHYSDAEHVLPLLDDGNGNPDTQSGDGIYSGSFVPLEDGVYSIVVHVSRDEEALAPQSSWSRLLPLDQVDTGCIPSSNGCEIIQLNQAASISEELSTLTFSNVHLYPGVGKPERIIDFSAERSISILNGLVFRFTSPKILGRSEQVTKYTIYGSTTHAALLENNQLEEFASFDASEDSGVEIRLLSTLTDENLVYFAVKSFYETSSQSELSVVARLYHEIQQNTPPTSSTTVSSPPTSSSLGTTVSTLPPEEEDTSHFLETPHGIAIMVFLGIVVLSLVAGGGYWWYNKRRNQASTSMSTC